MNLPKGRFLVQAGLFFFLANVVFVFAIHATAGMDVTPIAENMLHRVMANWLGSHPELASYLSGAQDAFPQKILESENQVIMIFAPDKSLIFQNSFQVSTSEALVTLEDVEEALRHGFGYHAENTVWTSIRIGDEPALGVLRWGFPALPWGAVLRNAWLGILPAFLILVLLEILVTWRSTGPILSGLGILLKSTRRYTLGHPVERIELPQHPDIHRLSTNIHLLLRQGDQKNEDLKRQNRELESLLGGMIEGVIVVDERLIIRRLNPAAKNLFAPNARGTEGRSLLEVTHSSSLLNMTEDLLWKAVPTEGEVSTQEGRYLQVRGSLVAGGDTQRLVILVLNDITHLRRLEEVRRDFVANVSHELKTPITNIKGYIETLLEEDVDAATRRKFHEVIHSHADRMANIIDDLLTLSRLEGRGTGGNEPATFCLGDAVREAIEVVQPKADTKEMQWVLTIEEKGAIILGHQRLAVQAVVNLLDNSVKYSEKGSFIEVSLGEDENWRTVKVKDRGIGIPAKDLDRIFERFYRVDKGRSREMGGTGLGLSIVKHIMILHGGRVEVSSAKGSGSTFTLYFPKGDSRAGGAFNGGK